MRKRCSLKKKSGGVNDNNDVIPDKSFFCSFLCVETVCTALRSFSDQSEIKQFLDDIVPENCTPLDIKYFPTKYPELFEFIRMNGDDIPNFEIGDLLKMNDRYSRWGHAALCHWVDPNKQSSIRCLSAYFDRTLEFDYGYTFKTEPFPQSYRIRLYIIRLKNLKYRKKLKEVLEHTQDNDKKFTNKYSVWKAVRSAFHSCSKKKAFTKIREEDCLSLHVSSP